MKFINFKRQSEPRRPFLGFSFRMPEPHVHVNPVAPSPKATTVLLVDDDPIILQTTGAKLQEAGYEVVTAGDGTEAISAISEKAPRFILLDIHFEPDITNQRTSGWDGFRLMFSLRGVPNARNARYIMLSGVNSQELKDQARRSGAIGFFTKPIDHRELLAVLQREESATNASKEFRRWWAALFSFL